MTALTVTEILEAEFKWPKASDKLFSEGHKGQAAYLPTHTSMRFFNMTEGYLRAADELVDRAASDDYQGELLVYPIVYCYRHYLELTLKYMLAQYGSIGGIKAVWDTHRLDDLWKKYRKLIRKLNIDSPDNRSDDEAVERLVIEFSKIDSHSSTFRFPVDKKGKLIDIDFERVDLIHLRNIMHGLKSYFTGSDGLLDDLKGYHANCC